MCQRETSTHSRIIALVKLPCLVRRGGWVLAAKSVNIGKILDCKTVRIFAYSSTREQSNKRSGMRLKTESETGERR